jgi:hypothetical protein
MLGQAMVTATLCHRRQIELSVGKEGVVTRRCLVSRGTAERNRRRFGLLDLLRPQTDKRGLGTIGDLEPTTVRDAVRDLVEASCVFRIGSGVLRRWRRQEPFLRSQLSIAQWILERGLCS